MVGQEPEGVDLDVPAGRHVQRQESDRSTVEDCDPVPEVGAVQVGHHLQVGQYLVLSQAHFLALSCARWPTSAAAAGPAATTAAHTGLALLLVAWRYPAPCMYGTSPTGAS